MAKKKSSSATRQGASGDDPVDFETALSEVEQIVALLEGGELGLTESLHQYEQGIKRLKQCHELLGLAEQRVSLLSGFDAEGNPISETLGQIEVRGGGGRENTGSAKNAASRRRESKSTPKADEGANGPVAGDRMDDFPGLF